MGHGTFDDDEPQAEMTLAEMRACCHLGSTRECTANTNKETTMVRSGHAEERLAEIESQAQRITDLENERDESNRRIAKAMKSLVYEDDIPYEDTGRIIEAARCALRGD